MQQSKTAAVRKRTLLFVIIPNSSVINVGLECCLSQGEALFVYPMQRRLRLLEGSLLTASIF